MEIKKIEALSYEWHTLTGEVIGFEKIDFKRLHKLFKESYDVIEELSKEKLVLKEVSDLLIEMNDFGWWVSDLDETPLHEFYQEIINLVTALKKYFLTRDCDVEAIKGTIEKIAEGTFASVEIKYE